MLFADINMPTHLRSQLASVCQRSKYFHAIYENSMRAAVQNAINHGLILLDTAIKHKISKSALHREVQKFKVVNRNQEKEAANNF